MNTRAILIFVGVVASTLAAIETAAPGSVALPIGVGGMLLIVGALLLYSVAIVVDFDQDPPVLRSELELSQGTLFDSAPAFEPPVPGDDLEALLAQFADRRIHSSDRFVERTKAIAAEAFEAYTDRSSTDAVAHLESGRWTEDPYAADFFGASQSSMTPPSLRLMRIFVPERAFRLSLSRAIDAIVDVSGVCSNSRDREKPASRSGLIERLPVLGRTDGLLEPDRPTEESETDCVDLSELPRTRRTNHWYGIGVVAVIGLGLGLLLEQAAIALSGVVGIVYAAYAQSVSVPSPEFSVTRSVSRDDPDVGEMVEVTVSIANDGSSVFSDLRLSDTVPPELDIVDGSPRAATVLRPGGVEEITYTVRAERGRHEFGPIRAVARNLPGSMEREIAIDSTSAIGCVPRYDPIDAPIPISAHRAQHAGSMATATGGDGTEFYATREYRLGDPWNRIDWNRLARTGERATLEFHRERTATVVILVDTYRSAYVAPSGDATHAVDRSVEAAGRLFVTLLASGHRVGLGTLGGEEYWLLPSSGMDHEDIGLRDLAVHSAFSSVPPATNPDPLECRRRLRRRLPADAQLLVVSPLCDRYTTHVLKRLRAHGYPTAVVSPDPTADRTPGHRLARLSRSLDVRGLRNADIPVVEWSPDEPLETPLRGRTR